MVRKSRLSEPESFRGFEVGNDFSKTLIFRNQGAIKRQTVCHCRTATNHNNALHCNGRLAKSRAFECGGWCVMNFSCRIQQVLISISLSTYLQHLVFAILQFKIPRFKKT